MKVYLAGQTNFGNRGCEALVRSTASMLHSRWPDARVLCPLDDVSTDAPQWPDASASGVDFVTAPCFPSWGKWWARAARVLPLEGLGIPHIALDAKTRLHIRDASALIMTGGDVITLDYGLLSLYRWCGFVDSAMREGVPAVLWAGSVGPFSSRPRVERVMVEHLNRYAAITVRETETLGYLQGIGVERVELVTDPAFNLEPEAFQTEDLLAHKGEGVLGVNVSPLIRKFRPDPASADRMDDEIVAFIEDVGRRTGLTVLLIPHVGSLDGAAVNSDHHYMQHLLARRTGAQRNVSLAPAHLNAAQLKYLIGQCRFFIGARTHSTIAALSCRVPTISIAYSVKAKGINKDLFGDLRYVLETPKVTRATLWDALENLQRDEASVHALLSERIPLWRQRATLSVDALMRATRR